MINIYAPNIGARKYIQKILTDIKRELVSNTVLGILTSHLHQWKIIQTENKETLVLNDTLDQTK